jgi:hypothetical protein
MPCLPVESCPVILPPSVNTGCAGRDGRRSAPCAHCALPPYTSQNDRQSVLGCHTLLPSSHADPPCVSSSVPLPQCLAAPEPQHAGADAWRYERIHALHMQPTILCSTTHLHVPMRVEPPRRSARRRHFHSRLLDQCSFQPLRRRYAMSLHSTSRSPAVKMNHF